MQTWNNADKKKAIIEELEAQGIIFEELKEEIKSDLDVFDLICHIAWDAPTLTRRNEWRMCAKEIIGQSTVKMHGVY